MPYIWTEPELFLEHRGVKVWHCYEDDNVSEHWFTTDPAVGLDSDDRDKYTFDARDLPLIIGMTKGDYDLRIRCAIDNEGLKLPESQSYHKCSSNPNSQLATEISRLVYFKQKAISNGSGNEYKVAWCGLSGEYIVQVLSIEGGEEEWLCLHKVDGESSDPERYFEKTGKSYKEDFDG